eukprot:206544_1
MHKIYFENSIIIKLRGNKKLHYIIYVAMWEISKQINGVAKRNKENEGHQQYLIEYDLQVNSIKFYRIEWEDISWIQRVHIEPIILMIFSTCNKVEGYYIEEDRWNIHSKEMYTVFKK